MASRSGVAIGRPPSSSCVMREGCRFVGVLVRSPRTSDGRPGLAGRTMMEVGTVSPMDSREADARRALVLHDHPSVVGVIELTLNHGLFLVRAASDLAEAEAILAEWRPQLAVVDMDREDSASLLRRLGASKSLSPSRTP